jgi:hypothetical protein
MLKAGLAALAAVSLCGAILVLQGGASQAAAQNRAPKPAIAATEPPTLVVAELFTSEGCSSCPPADEILNDLINKQPLETVTVLGLSEHVDYWDRQGWTDPFSSADFTKRQVDYHSHTFPRHIVYTPQLVIDGHIEHVGNDQRGVYMSILRASIDPRATVNVTAGAPSAGILPVSVKLTIPNDVEVSDAADIMLAITEDKLEADVRGGENGGKHLQHAGVVRKFITMGTLMQPAREWSGKTAVPLAAGWKPENLNVIAFLQQQQSRRILGAGITKVAGMTAARFGGAAAGR